jgi:hypothetical protein
METSGEAEQQNTPTPVEAPAPREPSGLERIILELLGRAPRPPIPGSKKKLAAIAFLDHKLTTDESGTAKLVLAEVKAQVENKRSAHRVIEGKAMGVIGFANAVMAFAASFDSSALLALHAGVFPAIAPTLIFELVAFIFGLSALGTLSYSLPDAALYNHPTTFEDKQNESRIAMALAQTWRTYESALDAGNVVRSRRLGVAMWSCLLGVCYTVGLTLWFAAFVPQHLPATSTPISSATPMAPTQTSPTPTFMPSPARSPVAGKSQVPAAGAS